jgi:thiamine pyrophosphokinase
VSILVFANGVIEEVEWIRPYLQQAAVIIAADGGGEHLARLGVRPDIVVGDMDSLDRDILTRWEAAGTAVVIHSAEKDETDLELALLHAAKQFAGDIKVFGALGGRLDQMLANILLLAHPAFAHRRIELVEPKQRAWLVEGRTEIKGKPEDLVSLIPLCGDVYIKRTAGLKWKMENELLQFGPARGISNVMLVDTAEVVVGSGVLLCVHLKNQW